VYIPRDHYSQESRGFAFVRFKSREDADAAMEKEDGRVRRRRRRKGSSESGLTVIG